MENVTTTLKRSAMRNALISVLWIVILLGFGGVGYWYINYKNNSDKDAELTRLQLENDLLKKQLDETEKDNESGDTVKKIECYNYGGRNEAAIGAISLVYPEGEDVEVTELTDQAGGCDFRIRYETAVMTSEQFIESYPFSINPNLYESLKIGMVQNPSGYGTPHTDVNLIRLQIEVSSNAQENQYRYTNLLPEASCQPNEFDPTLSNPCALGGNPYFFFPSSTILTIPKDESAAEIGEILEFFDYVNTNSSFQLY